MPRSSLHHLARSKIAVAIVALAVPAAALLLTVPAVNAQIDITSAPDVLIRVTQTPQNVTWMLGPSEFVTFTDLMLPTVPAGVPLRQGSAYDLTFSAIADAPTSGGYGYTGAGTTSVKLVNASTYGGIEAFAAGTSPITANLVGSDISNRTAVFGGIVFPGPGVWHLCAAHLACSASNEIARILVYPAEDLEVQISPAQATWSEAGTLFVVNVSRGGAGVGGAGLSSDASGFRHNTTDANGQFAFFSSSLPMGAGAFTIYANVNNSGPQSANGKSLPESLSLGTFRVLSANLTRDDVATTGRVGYQDVVTYGFRYPSNGNSVLVAGAVPAWNRLNISVVTPNNLLLFANISSLQPSTTQSLIPELQCLDLNSPNDVAGPCISKRLLDVPGKFEVNTGNGRLSFQPGDDSGGTNVWSNGTYTFRVEANIVGASTTAPEHVSSWGFSPASNSSAPPPQVEPPITNNTVQLTIGHHSGGLLLPVYAPLRLSNVSDFGELTVNMTFNSSIVQVENVTAGNLTGLNVTWNVNQTTGLLRILVTHSGIPGDSGNLTLATLVLRAQPAFGSTSLLDLKTVDAARSDGTSFAVTDVDGSFRSGLLGDVNADSLIDQVDATLLAQFVVGLASATEIVTGNADVNRDGIVNGVDAMFVAQYVGGARSTLS